MKAFDSSTANGWYPGTVFVDVPEPVGWEAEIGLGRTTLGSSEAGGGGFQAIPDKPSRRGLVQTLGMRPLDGFRRGVPHRQPGFCPLHSQGGCGGIIDPPEGVPPVEAHNEDEFAERIAQRAFATREQIGDQLLPWFIQALDESVQIFDPVGPEQWDTPCYWPPGPEPVRTLLNMRIAEVTMHAWDVCSQLEPDYHLSQGSLGPLIDAVPRAVRRGFRPDPSLSDPRVYATVRSGGGAPRSGRAFPP